MRGKEAAMRRIGIMGGTFDPIHNGHLAVGRQAYREYQLDEVWFMPSGHPPHKKDHAVTDAADRCAMTRLAIRNDPYFRFSDFEVRREGNTYTAQTLTLLRRQYPDVRFYFIIGADSLFEIESWYMPEKIMEQAVILVAGSLFPGKEKSGGSDPLSQGPLSQRDLSGASGENGCGVGSSERAGR